ncbi:MAG: beta-ketoacyl-ACP synthase III [Anaerolineae bacterium]
MGVNGSRPRGFNGTRYAHIIGWGVDVPEHVMTNHDIEKLVETSDQWIRERTGIHERRIAGDRDNVVTMGVRAARRAIQRAGILSHEIDLVIVATSSPLHLFPATACLIQDRIGASDAGAFDVLAACTGFIYALGLASAQIKAGMIDTALVIGTETLSRLVDWSDRSTCILFGDGAGAFVLKASDQPGGVQDVIMHADGSGADHLYVGSGIRPTWDGEQTEQRIDMNGREVFRFASRVMSAATEEITQRACLHLEDVDLIIPHQANVRIIQAAARGLKLPMDRFFVNIEKYGNTSTASIPLAVVEALESGRVGPGDRLVLVGFGSGLTWGAALVEWEVEQTPGSVMREAMQEAYYIFAYVRSFLRRLFRIVETVVFKSHRVKDNTRKRRRGPDN